MLLSIVLPAYNEEHRIGGTLDQVVEYRRASAHEVEVIVVDDGSSDASAVVAESYAGALPALRVLRHDVNRGKGRAVATGMLAATGVYRAFFDADGATPIVEVDKLLTAALGNPRAVPIGSIRAPGTTIGRHQPLVRTVAGRAGNLFMRAMVLPGVADSQRGCKLFPGALAETVFGAQQIDGWGFDIEVLALCQRLGYQVLEIPVRWNHVDGGQVRASAYVTTLREVLRIRRLLRTGAHRLDSVAPLTPQVGGLDRSPA